MIWEWLPRGVVLRLRASTWGRPTPEVLIVAETASTGPSRVAIGSKPYQGVPMGYERPLVVVSGNALPGLVIRHPQFAFRPGTPFTPITAVGLALNYGLLAGDIINEWMGSDEPVGPDGKPLAY